MGELLLSCDAWTTPPRPKGDAAGDLHHAEGRDERRNAEDRRLLVDLAAVSDQQDMHLGFGRQDQLKHPTALCAS